MDRNYFRNERAEMMPLIPIQRERILEIGCGEGLFSANIPGTSETWGIEPDERSANQAASCLSHVLPTTFEDAKKQLPLHAFDVVICNDVIEHMDDHDRFFSEIRPYLTQNGVLVGSVPNVRYFRNIFDFLILQDWHYKDSGILDRTHKRFFTLRSLRRSLIESDYRINILTGINSKLTMDFTRGQARYTAFGYGIIGLSAGYMHDIRFMQLAFSASPNGIQ